MNAGADESRTGLRFGPNPSNVRSSRHLTFLFARLVVILGLMILLASSSFQESGAGHDGDRIALGTVLIEPRTERQQLPDGMVLAAAEPHGFDPPDSLPKDLQNEAGVKTKSNQVVEQDAPARATAEELQFQQESLVDLDRDLPAALYFHFLDKARQVRPEQLIADGRRDLTFSHLYKDPRKDPAKYRGQLVSLRGTVRRALAFDIDENAYGLKKRYELWLFTEDSGKFPWVVELTDLPEGFPLGTEIQEKVETAGYFLKLWAYRAQDGFRSAPLILGHGLTWERGDLIRSRFNRQFGTVAFGFIGIFVILIGWTLWRWNSEDRGRRITRSVPVFDRLEDIRPDGTDDDGALSRSPK